MGLLDEAIREHLELKRRRGADPSEVERAEREALGPVHRHPEPLAAPGPAPHPAPDLSEPPEEHGGQETVEYQVGFEEHGEESADDVLEETPEFLQDTPDHDRLWFEQRPPRDFDFDS